MEQVKLKAKQMGRSRKMKIRDLVEKYGTGDNIRQKIATALPYIFDFDFPMYDNSYKTVLETKIIKHYMNRELCYDDEEKWNLELDTWLNENMPLFNQRYGTTLIQIQPLINNKLETSHSGTGSQTQRLTDLTTKSGTESGTEGRTGEAQHSHGDTVQTEGTSTKHGDITKKHSDTPMGDIASLDDGYLTAAEKDHEESSVGDNRQEIHTGQETSQTEDDITTSRTTSETLSGTKNSTLTDTNSYLQSVVGNVGISQSKLLEEFRDILIDIDKEIINSMATLFSTYGGAR